MCSALASLCSPQLRTLRGLVREWCEQQQQQQQQVVLPWRDLTAAYASALSAAHPGSSSSDRASSKASSSAAGSNAGASVLLAQLLAEGFKLLSAEEASLLNCRHDSSLDAAWRSAHASNTSTNTSNSSSSAKRHLLAANFHNSAAVLPNFLLQALRLALKLPHGSLAVGVYESGSSDTSR